MRQTATLYKALGDETRLKMLWLLMRQRELCVCDFMEVLQITQSKASRHLRNLFHAGLVDDRREGLWVYYALRPTKNALVRATLRALKSSMNNNEECQALHSSLACWLETKNKRQRCASRGARA